MWKDYQIINEDIEPLRALIPEYCVSALLDGSLSGSVILNDDSDTDPVVGVVLHRITGDQIEVEWVSPVQAYDLPDHGADMVHLVAERARLAGGFRGLFARFREGDWMTGFFPEEEYTWTRESDRIYRFRLQDADSLDKQSKNGRSENCVPLNQTDHAMQNALLADAGEHEVSLPIARPVRWEDYDQEVSAFYRGDDGRAIGAILVDKQGDELVIRLLYSLDSVAAIALLEYAFGAAREKYGAEQAVACPVLNGVSEALVKKIVRDPVCGEVIRAQLLFTPDLWKELY